MYLRRIGDVSQILIVEFMAKLCRGFIKICCNCFTIVSVVT